MTTININKSISRDRWVEFFDQLSDGNRGRHITIEVISAGLGNEELIRNAPLMAMIYDPRDQGDSPEARLRQRLTIETGKEEVNYAHTVESPLEVLTGQDANGILQAVRITDLNGGQTLIKF
jgi:hypothetical protein